MATGQSGGFGKSVQRAVDKVTGPEPESAAIHQLSTVGSHVMVALWIQSCAILGLARVRENWLRISCLRHFLCRFLVFLKT